MTYRWAGGRYCAVLRVWRHHVALLVWTRVQRDIITRWSLVNPVYNCVWGWAWHRTVRWLGRKSAEEQVFSLRADRDISLCRRLGTYQRVILLFLHRLSRHIAWRFCARFSEYNATMRFRYPRVYWWLFIKRGSPKFQWCCSAVGIATGYWLDVRGFGVRIPVRSRYSYSYSSYCPHWFLGPPSL
jgi:hypothetical protein